MEYTVEAQVIDSHYIKVIKPIDIAPGSMVKITIDLSNSIAEDKDWYLLSAQGLERAYGEDEPEYTLDDIKIFNPDFEP